MYDTYCFLACLPACPSLSLFRSPVPRRVRLKTSIVSLPLSKRSFFCIPFFFSNTFLSCCQFIMLYHCVMFSLHFDWSNLHLYSAPWSLAIFCLIVVPEGRIDLFSFLMIPLLSCVVPLVMLGLVYVSSMPCLWLVLFVLWRTIITARRTDLLCLMPILVAQKRGWGTNTTNAQSTMLGIRILLVFVFVFFFFFWSSFVLSCLVSSCVLSCCRLDSARHVRPEVRLALCCLIVCLVLSCLVLPCPLVLSLDLACPVVCLVLYRWRDGGWWYNKRGREVERDPSESFRAHPNPNPNPNPKSKPNPKPKPKPRPDPIFLSLPLPFPPSWHPYHFRSPPSWHPLTLTLSLTLTLALNLTLNLNLTLTLTLNPLLV